MYWLTIIRVLVEEENTIVIIIVTHQVFENHINGDDPPSPKVVVLFEAK